MHVTHSPPVSTNDCLAYMFTAYLGPKRTTTDGFDYTFQVNFLGHFLLTSLLCRALAPMPASPLRVVNMASHSYAEGRLDDLEDLNKDSRLGTSRPYQQYQMYAASKLAVVMYTAQIALRQGPSVVAVAVHPGKGSPSPHKKSKGKFFNSAVSSPQKNISATTLCRHQRTPI